jgi:hypothetical protein
MDKRWLGRIEALVWILIYGGMLSGTLGLFMLHASGGLALLVAGGIAIVLGILLIWLRSRWP